MIFSVVVTCSLSLMLHRPSTAAERSDGAANTVEAALSEYAIDAEQLEALAGQTADVLLNDGDNLIAATISSFTTRRRDDRVSVIRLEHEGKRRKYPAAKVYSMRVNGRPYKVNYLPSQKAAALVDVVEHRATVTERLQGKRHRFWKEFTDEEQAKHVAKHKEFLKEVKKHFAPRINLRLAETKYFLFLTDMPAAQVKPYLRQLDAMNVEMGQAFGYEPGHNIWKGKAVVVAFVNRAHFLEFEAQFMNNTDVPERTQGLCHSDSTGRVVVGCYRGESASYFGAVLVHETAHGYVARFRTTARIPSWLNEGISDWIAGIAVPTTKAIAKRQRDAAQRLRVMGTFGGQFYDASQIEGWQYGAASAMVNLLIAKDPVRFKLFVNGIKEGYEWQVSLRRAYNASVADLTRLYGRSIGVPNLSP